MKKDFNKDVRIFCKCGCGKKIRKYDSKNKRRYYKDGHKGPHIKKLENENTETMLKLAKNEIIQAAMLTSAYLNKNGNSKNPSLNILKNNHTRNIVKLLKPILDSYGIPLRTTKYGYTTGNSYLLNGLYKIWHDKNGKIPHPSSVKVTPKIKSILKLMPRTINESARKRIGRTKRKNAKIKIRSDSKKVFENSNLVHALKNDAIINGVLLSDGSIVKRQTAREGQNLQNHNAWFKLEQKRSQNFIFHLRKHLMNEYLNDLVSIKKTFCIPKPRSIKRKNNYNGKVNQITYLQTRAHPFFTELRKIWYVRKKNIHEGEKKFQKVVPNHLRCLDAKTVAWWYMGDGSRGTKDDERNINKAQIEFATEGFSKKDVKRLVSMLKKLGFEAKMNRKIITPEIYRVFGLKKLDKVEKDWMKECIHEVRNKISYKNGRQYVIKISDSENVQNFFDYVSEYIIPVFKYKIKQILVRSRDQFRKERIDKAIARIRKSSLKSKDKKPIILVYTILKNMLPEKNRKIYLRLKRILDNWKRNPDSTIVERKNLIRIIESQSLDNFNGSGELIPSRALKNYLS